QLIDNTQQIIYTQFKKKQYLYYRNKRYGNCDYDEMKFYNREVELVLLSKTEQLAHQYAQMTFMVGRRRIGKTSLLVKAYEQRTCLYFFVAKKNEVLLCAEFIEEIKQKLSIPFFGEIKSFKEVFGLLMELSKTRHFTLIIDEFQEFQWV